MVAHVYSSIFKKENLFLRILGYTAFKLARVTSDSVSFLKTLNEDNNVVVMAAIA